MSGSGSDPFSLVSELIRTATDPTLPDAERAAAGRQLGSLPLHILRLLGDDDSWDEVLRDLVPETSGNERPIAGSPAMEGAIPRGERPGSISLPVFSRELNLALQREWDRIDGEADPPDPRGLLTPFALINRLGDSPSAATRLLDRALSIDPLDPLPAHLQSLLPSESRLLGQNDQDLSRSHRRMLGRARRFLLDRRTSLLFDEPIQDAHLHARLHGAGWIRSEEVVEAATAAHVDLDLVFRFVREVSLADVRRAWGDAGGDPAQFLEAARLRLQRNELALDRAVDLLLEGVVSGETAASLSKEACDQFRLLRIRFEAWRARWIEDF